MLPENIFETFDKGYTIYVYNKHVNIVKQNIAKAELGVIKEGRILNKFK